jgi:hypothetical protein
LNREARELRERQQYAAPPAGEFVPAPSPPPAPATVLVPRAYYYWDNHYGGYVRVYLSCPLWWVAPSSWVLIGPGVWLPPVFIGTVWSGWDWNYRRIVVNNIAVRHGVNHAEFRDRFHCHWRSDDGYRSWPQYSGREPLNRQPGTARYGQHQYGRGIPKSPTRPPAIAGVPRGNMGPRPSGPLPVVRPQPAPRLQGPPPARQSPLPRGNHPRHP